MASDPMASGRSMLALEGIGLRIGGARILAGVSLEVPAGQMLGVIGPNLSLIHI